MTPRDGSVLALRRHLVGLGVRRETRLTFSVLTTAALGELAEVHDRMPLLLPPERWSSWLAPTDEPGRLLHAGVAGAAGAGWRSARSGAAVGDVRNDGPQLIARVPVAPR